MTGLFNDLRGRRASLRLRKRSPFAPGLIEALGEPCLARPDSQVCTEAQFYEPAYAYWCGQFKEEPRTHRKQWEFCYILQALATRGKLAPQFRGLGFGVGEEPLTALFASRGVEVTGTDLDAQRAAEAGWTESAQHASALQDLNGRGICAQDRFAALVSFETVDMNAIPTSLRDFDFTWSACALEHLGSLKHGAEFILNSLDTLRPGGMAVHTTEYNLANGPDTLEEAATVLFRRRDLEPVLKEAVSRGCAVSVNWSPGGGQLDAYVDQPPYSPDRHLKLSLESYVTTSIGLIIETPP